MSTIEHPTMINRDYIRLLQVMRRFIREEFACDIRISQDDVIEQLLHYSDRSRNHVLQEMGKELQEFVQQMPVAETDDAPKVRYYRGAAIVVAEEENELKTVTPVVQAEQPKRIYRGQVIGG